MSPSYILSKSFSNTLLSESYMSNFMIFYFKRTWSLSVLIVIVVSSQFSPEFLFLFFKDVSFLLLLTFILYKIYILWILYNSFLKIYMFCCFFFKRMNLIFQWLLNKWHFKIYIYSGCFFLFIFNQGIKVLYGTQNGVRPGIENYKTVCFKIQYNRKHVCSN